MLQLGSLQVVGDDALLHIGVHEERLLLVIEAIEESHVLHQRFATGKVQGERV